MLGKRSRRPIRSCRNRPSKDGFDSYETRQQHQSLDISNAETCFDDEEEEDDDEEDDEFRPEEKRQCLWLKPVDNKQGRKALRTTASSSGIAIGRKTTTTTQKEAKTSTSTKTMDHDNVLTDRTIQQLQEDCVAMLVISPSSAVL